MAGYAIDLGEAGTSYAQGVTMPSATELGATARGLETLGRGLFSVMDDMASAGKKTQSAIDREMYGSFSKDLQSLKGQEGLTLRSSVNKDIALSALFFSLFLISRYFSFFLKTIS